MPSKVSLISDVSGDITIEGGTFTLNAQQTTIRKRLTKRDFNDLCSVLDSANAKQNDDLGHIIESRMQSFSKSLENHQNAVSTVVRRLQPPIGYVQQDTADALFSKAQQLVKLLPAAHRELALQFAGAVRPHTSARRFGDNLALVGAPLLSSSIFSTFSAEVQFMVFYFLVAIIFVDLFHPRLIHNRPSSRVNVLDALGKYHNFPWSACENPMTFHAEFLRRFLNQTGFTFVKSKLYEVEYDGSIMKPDDWATIKPFTDLFVNFVLIQQGEQSRVVRCPWCRWENPLPSDSGSEESTTKCSCSECGRDFSAAVGSSVDDGDKNILPPGLDKPFSVEIRRFRIRLQRRKQSFPTPLSLSPIIPGVTVPMPQVYDGPLPPGFVPQTITDPYGVTTPMWQSGPLPPISIEPPSPTSPYVPLLNFESESPFLSPNHRPYQLMPEPPSLPRQAQAYKYEPEDSFLSPNYRPVPLYPLTPTPPSLPRQAQAYHPWYSSSVEETGYPRSEPFISIEPPSPIFRNSPLAEDSSPLHSPEPGPLAYSPYQQSYKPWSSPTTLPHSAPSISREDSFSTESDALRERQRQLYELLEFELLVSPDDSTSSTSSHVYDRFTCLASADGPTADDPACTIGPSGPHLLRPNDFYGGTPDGELGSSGDPPFIYIDDTGVLEPDRVMIVSDNSSIKHHDENLTFSSQGKLESAEDSMNMLGLWGMPLMSQPSLDEG